MEILFVKMVAIILNFFGVLGFAQAFIFPGSDESNACISDDDSLTCICKNRENIPLTANMNFNIAVIQVSGCGNVDMPFGALTHLELDKMIFSDIYQLDIRPFALVGSQSLHTLLIENVEIFNVWTHGFVGLLNVTNIIIRNVSAVTLQEGGFGGISYIENFLIENSDLGHIKNGAFILTNITLFGIRDTIIQTVESNSFLIHKAQSVLFQNCSISEVKNHSFSMAYIDSLTFSECNFGFVDSNSIFLKYSESFIFEACTVSELKEFAITLVNVTKNVSFSHNVIKFGDGHPLEIYSENSTDESSKTENYNVYACCNSFLCNCDIYWIWSTDDPFYDFKTSFCLGTGTSFSDMSPILDSQGNCMTLESKKGRSNTDEDREIVDDIKNHQGLTNLEDSKNLESRKMSNEDMYSSKSTFIGVYSQARLLCFLILCAYIHFNIVV